MTEYIKIPAYEGSESSNEDIVYSYFRRILNQNGYSFKVKRTGFPEIDNIIPSNKTGTKGKGSCDAYIFSFPNYNSFYGLLELESTGKLEVGIKQIQNYIKGFSSKSLLKEQLTFVEKFENRTIPLIVYDGQKIYLSIYNFDTLEENIVFDRVSIASFHDEVSLKLYEIFKKKEQINREDDERELVNIIANIIRGHEKLQKNKALLMTILASIYGATKQLDYENAVKELKSSQTDYDVKLADTLVAFLQDIPEKNDIEKIPNLYEKAASKLFEMSQDRGMDLYGFIYEELASKESKKEQGEYYTPRHTIKPLINSVYTNFLNWDIEEIESKVIFDPFCGSGGFLYEYIQLIKQLFNLSKKKVDDIARKTIWGVDKNNVLAAYLNLFLIGDGSANIHRVKTSINWRKQFMYKNHNKEKFKVNRIEDQFSTKYNLKSSISDLHTLIKLYVNKSFKFDLEDLDEYINNGSVNPILDFVLESQNFNKTGKNEHYLGNVDLLITNVPYGKVTEATEQFIEDGEAIYKNSLEANGLRECIDFLRPAKLKNGKIIEEGGIAIAVIPDSILENPSNKPIRDYLIARCNILGIIGLPPYTFSPYAMEKTFAIIFQKIAPEQFDYDRELDQPCFMYYSLCDGKANSQNRFRTDLIGSSKIKTSDGKETQVLEFIHNDFEPCYDTFDPKKLIYRSKLEWAWNYNFASLNKDWDQSRITETWTGKSWKKFEGKKWGYFKISKYQREIERSVKSKTLQEKLKQYFILKTEEEIEQLTDVNYFSTFLKDIGELIELTPTELQKITDLSSIKYKKISEEDFEIELIATEIIDDVDINPDSSRYLGVSEENINFDVLMDYIKSSDVSSEEDIINLFRNDFYSESQDPVKLMDRFDIIQGNSFSKRDAYLYPGNTPVYTAATDGPAYYVDNNIPKKVKVSGPSLIWSRKGAKAGTIQIFNNDTEFFISDVSGTIKPKSSQQNYNLNFLKYYIAGQVKRELQSKSNNAQLNKSKLENLKIFLPTNQDEIWKVIEEKLVTS
ncbi:N-6 DNA methylase [Chryseobacterium sp. LC2016-29]|uniref:N-6 DNA methylase n=1 Tax=Chryseobacterium sp. LC2016-29 TaxID=2897331 RepID=UPI001E5D9910|nr:N-6 DNA methylase [Chryseobacterium sp. LC2016-29]MCD0477800.1 N-6 DNA methylase [Chryseobacterium sp. LC2016-29]